MKRIIPLLGLLALLCTGCGASWEPAQVQFFAMDTVMTVTAYGKQAEQAARAVQEKVNDLDKLWSRTDENSEISRLNAHAGDGTMTALSPETAEILARAMEMKEESGGAFDPLLAPVMDAWGFTQSAYRVPEEGELAALLSLTEPDPELTYDDGFANAAASLKTEGQELDLGGIAKGMATCYAARAAREYDIDGLLLDLGGNLYTWGEKPDGSAWKIGVKDPNDTAALLCAFPMNDRTCSTSGGYERYFEQDGVIYHHIIDPADGYPAHSGLISVTVVGDSVWADAYSTACFVLGAEKTLDLWRAGEGLAGQADFVLVTEDRHVYLTEGLEEGLSFLGEENGYTYEIVYR